MSWPEHLDGKRALVYSMGIEGRDLASWLLSEGARVTMSDTRDHAALAAAGAGAPDGVEAVRTGEPLLDPEGFDVVAVSQSVLRSSPAMERVRRLKIPFTSQMRLFLQLCPAARIVGITGASGKSTTTSLVGAMARAAGVDHILGGNLGTGGTMGAALLEQLPRIRRDTLVILEISHTQLQYTDRSPAIAAVTNVTPNHLDQFSWDEYVGLKRHLLEYQGPEDVAVLNQDDQTSQALVPAVAGRLLRTSTGGAVEGEGGWIEEGHVAVRRDHRQQRVARLADSPLRGAHNAANIVMACCVATAADVPAEAISEGVRSFRGVPHRLETVGRAFGATWVNDSIATTAERTVAGLDSYTEPIVLLLGGKEKDLPLDRLRERAAERCRAVVCFGRAATLFFEALHDCIPECLRVETLADAVAEASRLVTEGDVVLFSPAATSFDAFPNFETRGEMFRDLVRKLEGFREASL
ncbi:MAG: UDP-N-acetylmuramoyl-L-alanine--D-glutamate ligase [Dehalococcoidia bacterium]